MSRDNRFPEPPGHDMTISCPAGKKATPADISGCIDHFGKIAKFTGLEPAKPVNFYLIKRLEWQTDARQTTAYAS
jgi:hypothetical protein